MYIDKLKQVLPQDTVVLADDVTFALNEDDMIALLHGLAQATVQYDLNHIDTNVNLWHLDCCEYNVPIKALVKQVNPSDFNSTQEYYLNQLSKNTI